ncbi:Uncharacterised protein [Streptococcus porcinus]|nr:Uncharacterised protein [Streptococcus porcinus]
MVFSLNSGLGTILLSHFINKVRKETYENIFTNT